MKSKWKKILIAVVVIAFFILPLYLRCLYEANLGLNEGRDLLISHDSVKAVKSFAHAVKWRSVANPYAVEAEKELTILVETLSGESKIDALKEFRRALFVSRSFYTEDRDQVLIAQVTKQLEDLGARKPSPITLSNPFQVSFSHQILAQVGFWGWVASVLALIYWGFTAEGKFIKRPAIICLLLALSFFIFWLNMLRVA